MKSWVEISERRLTGQLPFARRSSRQRHRGPCRSQGKRLRPRSRSLRSRPRTRGRQVARRHRRHRRRSVREALCISGIDARRPAADPRHVRPARRRRRQPSLHHELTPVVWEQQQMETLAAAVRQRGGNASPCPSTSKSTPAWHVRASHPESPSTPSSTGSNASPTFDSTASSPTSPRPR